MTNAPRCRLTLRPGAPGTKEAFATHGERLVMVRYRYDAERGVRIKTVELTVEEVPWPPAEGKSVDVRIDPDDAPLRAAIEQHGATRRRDEIWSVPRRAVHALGIADKVIQKLGGRRGG